MKGHGRSTAVLDVTPLSFTCALGWPDIQGQAHLHGMLRAEHGGLEAGRFARRGDAGSLLRGLYRKVQSQSASRAEGLYVAVPCEYMQVYMRTPELPIYGRVQSAHLEELSAMAREAAIPPRYRLLSERPIAWQVDSHPIGYHSPIGQAGKLLKGYYAVSYGYNPYCLDMADMVDEAGIAFRGFVPIPDALMRYAARRLNLLGTFALVDSDALSTHVMAAQRSKLWLMQRIPAGAERLRQDVMQALPTGYEEACRLLDGLTLGPRVGDGSLASQVVETRVREIMAEAAGELSAAGVFLEEPLHLVLSGEGWTGIPGAADLVAGQAAARISILTPPSRGASIHSIAMLDQVLDHRQPERSWWENVKQKIRQTKH